ncbi:MAG: DMT family transporter [Aquificaceae bacterium]|nr:DMT family transporter [Aquificaceae bacterium]MCX8164418.1 DMT family transporter [Aquificaceae bacterium]
MLGLSLALISSLFWGTNDYISKRLLAKGLDENFVLWVRFPISLVILTPLGIYYWDMSLKLITYSLFWLPFEVLGGVFFIKGLKYTSLSVAMSFYSFVPVFSALFGWLLLSEKPSTHGLLGILLIVSSTLLIVGFSPKEFLKTNRGALYMLVSTILFGFNVALGKLSVVESNGLFFSWYYCLLMSVGMLFFLRPSKITKVENYRHWEVPAVGMLFAFGDVLYNLALSLTLSSYVASAERLSLLVALFYGKFFLGESSKHFLIPALLMLLGNSLMALE